MFGNILKFPFMIYTKNKYSLLKILIIKRNKFQFRGVLEIIFKSYLRCLLYHLINSIIPHFKDVKLTRLVANFFSIFIHNC